MRLQVASIQQEYPQQVACGMMSFIQQDPDTLEPMPGSQGTPGGEQSPQVTTETRILLTQTSCIRRGRCFLWLWGFNVFNHSEAAGGCKAESHVRQAAAHQAVLDCEVE